VTDAADNHRRGKIPQQETGEATIYKTGNQVRIGSDPKILRKFNFVSGTNQSQGAPKKGMQSRKPSAHKENHCQLQDRVNIQCR
jgi:hypothetical protein